jgi:hypothetical protein
VTLRTKGLVIAAVHVAIVCTLGAKLLVDRTIRPRVWVEVEPYDPDLPIRGRYLSLQVKATARGFADSGQPGEWSHALLSVEDDRLIATRTETDAGEPVRIRSAGADATVVLATPIAYFIPEHVDDPSRTPGLMVEVTLPRKGPPRPIRLGVRNGDRITPLDL